MKKRMNRVLTLALALVMCLSLAACGGSKDSGTPAPSQDAAQDTADGKTFKVGVCGRDFTSPFQTSLYESMEEAAKAYPEIKLDIRDGEGDPSVQVNILQTFIEQKKDLIVVVANQVDTLIPAINQCVDAGIPVINTNCYVGDGSKILTFIGCDDRVGGYRQGELINKAIGDSGKIALIQATLGTAYQIARTEGIENYISEKAPGIEIVAYECNDNDNAKTVTIMQNLLTRFPAGELDGIVVQGPLDAIAAADACIDAGRDELVGKIVAMDYSTQVEEAIKEGKLYGTVNQDPVTYGKLTVEYIAKYMTGEMKAEDFEKEIDIDLPTVDASNVNDTAATWS